MNSKLRILDLLLVLALVLGISSAVSVSAANPQPASPAPARTTNHIAPQTAQQPAWHSVYPTYNKVRMASATDGWVVGWNGAIKRYLGNNVWGEFASPVTTTLNSVYPISNTAWIVGANNVILNFTHGDWVQVPAPAGCTYFHDVWMTSVSDGWAVGSDCFSAAGEIAHYDGTSWQRITLPSGTGELNAVQMISPSEGWAVGYNTILHYTGGTWQTNSSPNLTLSSLAMLPDGSEGWAGAVATTGGVTTMHYSGGVWGNTYAKPAAPQRVTGTQNYYASGMAALSATDRWFVGMYVNTAGPPTNGIYGQASGANTWTVNATTDADPLNSVYMVATNDVWAVGASGYIKHYDGTNWTNIQGAPMAINGMAYNNARHELYQAGYNTAGAILVTNTDTGQVVVSCSTPGVVWRGITTLDTTSLDAWAVGNGGKGAHITASGCAISQIADISIDLDAVYWGFAASMVAVGINGSVVVYDGGWNNPAINLGSYPLYGVTYYSGRWWAVGAHGAIYTVMGDPSAESNWDVVTATNTDTLYSVSGVSSTEAWAVGNGVRYHITAIYTAVRQTSDTNLRAVYMTSPSSGWAVGYSGGIGVPNMVSNIEYYNGNSWSTIDAYGAAANSPAFSASGEGWAGGNSVGDNLGTSGYQLIPGYLLHFYPACYDYYYDVPPGYYAGSYIFDLSCKGIVSGVAPHIFNPNANATRIQFAKIITLARGWALYNPPTPDFSDVPSSNFLYQFVETAFHNGAISGATQATCTARGLAFPCFLPNDPITRAQTVIITVRAYNWPVNTTGGPHFSDVPTTNFAYNAVETAYNKGVVSGTGGGMFSPNANVTRGQIAKVVDLALHAP